MGEPITFMARCEVCGDHKFDAREIVAYQRRGSNRERTLEAVDLGGREPWSGVRCVCRACVMALGAMARATESDLARIVREYHERQP